MLNVDRDVKFFGVEADMKFLNTGVRIDMKHVGVLALVVTVVASSPQLGEAQGRSDREWQNSVLFYGLVASVTGDGLFGPIEQPDDVPIGNTLDNLQMAFLGAYRGSNDRFSVVADVVYLALGNSKDTGLVRRADLDMLLVDVTVGYRFSPIVEAFGGLRVTGVSAKIGLGDPIRREFEPSETFYDPIFGARVMAPLDEGRKWWLQSRGDIGGFGAGMDFTWQAMAQVGFKPSEWISIWGGYRALGQDFDEAGEREKFSMDLTYHGPVFGVGFHF